MELNSESLRLILGVKVRQFRDEKGLSLKQLAERTKLSISYLSEIEKGKKYPKPEKIVQIAHALDKKFDELVSLQLDEESNPLASLLNSAVIREFPLEQFGLTVGNIFELVNDSPAKIGALVRALLEIGRSYDMHVETFFLASLRSYQKMHHNYFADLEAAAAEFIAAHDDLLQSANRVEQLTKILSTEFDCSVETQDLQQIPGLGSLRSIWVSDSPDKVVLNDHLLEEQQFFLLLREIGYRQMGLMERPSTSSWVKVESFEQALNNFKASYFAGAIIIPESRIRDDLNNLLGSSRWDSALFKTIFDRYRVTPETFLHRLSQVLPHHFGLQKLHYLRVNNTLGENKFIVTKELNTTDVFVPRGIGLTEHHCRRWIAIGLLQELANSQQHGDHPHSLISTQRSCFIQKDQTFFNFAMVRPLTLTNDTNSGMTLGFLIDDQFKQQVKFWNDPSVKERAVNETCERCALSVEECKERVAPPILIENRNRQRVREEALAKFISDHQ